jgi:predicted nucleic acid-binding protein
MRHLPDKRKPVAVAATGLQVIGNAGSYSDIEDATKRTHLQAARLRSRFAISWHVAHVVAELHYGSASA